MSICNDPELIHLLDQEELYHARQSLRRSLRDEVTPAMSMGLNQVTTNLGYPGSSFLRPDMQLAVDILCDLMRLADPTLRSKGPRHWNT